MVIFCVEVKNVITEVYNNIYLNEIPLPNNSLQVLNSYIIKSKHRNLIVDSGFDLPACKEALYMGIKKLKVDLFKTDLVVTHMHPDHSGLAADLESKGVVIYMNKKEADFLNEGSRKMPPGILSSYANMLGFDTDNFSGLEKEFENSIKKPLKYVPLNQNEKLRIGNYIFEVVDIPGHSPGHIGLYERQHKLLFSGDHILERITPNINFGGFGQDIFAIYLDSLKKVYDFEVDYLFPGHGNVIRDHKKRIDEIFEHHNERLAEVSEIIRYNRKSPVEVASKMRWNVSYDDWIDFPDSQKWFATGEAISHLEHLVSVGIAECSHFDGKIFYSINRSGMTKKHPQL